MLPPYLRITALAAVVSIVPPLPLAAQPAAAAPGGVPIHIDRCSVVSRSFLQDPFNGTRVEVVRGVAVAFTNGASVAAKRVAISIGYAGATQAAAVSGSFAPGVAVARTVAAFTDVPYAGAAAQCRLTSAAFADGTAWDRRP